MSLEDHYQAYAKARSQRRNADAHQVLCAARNGLNFSQRPEDFEWLESALEHADKRVFVVAIFRTASLPKRLFAPMIRAAIREPDVSRQKFFIEPCVATFGSQPVIDALSLYIREGTPDERESADRAMYWGRYQRNQRGTQTDANVA